MRLRAGVDSARHAHNERADQRARQGALALFQRSTKAILLFSSYTIIVVLWIEFVHALLESPPEVLNWVEVW
jgi:hypothetical protein